MHWAQGRPSACRRRAQLCVPFWLAVPAITPFLRAGKLRLRQTDVSDLERNARLPTQKWVRGVERRGDLTTVTLGRLTRDRL